LAFCATSTLAFAAHAQAAVDDTSPREEVSATDDPTEGPTADEEADGDDAAGLEPATEKPAEDEAASAASPEEADDASSSDAGNDDEAYAVDPVSSEPAPVATWRLTVSPDADERFRGCIALVATDEPQARDCLRELQGWAPDTTAGLRAEAALAALEAQVPAPLARQVDEATSVSLIPVGRLGVTTAAGLFGAWNGVAGTLIYQVQNPNSPVGTAFIAGGIGAVALGVGFGVGGFFLAEALDLDEGAARLVASGLIWGTTLSIGPAVAIAEAVARNAGGPLLFSLPLATVVAGGYVGGLATLGLALLLPFDEAQVSLINTGGWVGSLVGGLVLIDMAVFRVAPDSLSTYGLTYSGIALGTLLGAGVLGRFVHLTWGEALLIDLGAVLGSVSFGAVSVGVMIGGLGFGMSPEAITLAVTSSIGGGALIGAGAALAGGLAWRAFRGERLLRDLSVLRLKPGQLSYAIDLDGELVAIAPLLAFDL
jgi:hypothetical protein